MSIYLTERTKCRIGWHTHTYYSIERKQERAIVRVYLFFPFMKDKNVPVIWDISRTFINIMCVCIRVRVPILDVFGHYEAVYSTFRVYSATKSHVA